MEMTRVELMLTVEQAAREAAVSNDDTARLVNAVADLKVIAVARGDWTAYGEKCPATLVGLEPGKGRGGMFATKFDSMTRKAAVEAGRGKLAAQAAQGHDSDYERYIIRIV